MKTLSYKQKDEMVKRILGGYLLPKGYTMEGFREHDSWIFVKKENDVTRVIDIKSPGVEHINLYAHTSAKMEECAMSNYLIKNGKALPHGAEYPQEWECDDWYMGWKYADKEEFEHILSIFTEIIERYVFAMLDEMGRLDPIHVTTQNYLYMQENLDEIISKGRAQWDLEGKTLEEQVTILTEQVEQEKGKGFREAEKQLANIAAVYGDSLIRAFGGRWKGIEFSNTILVKNIGNRQVICWPLKLMLSVWKGETKIENDLARIKSEIAQKPEIVESRRRWGIKRRK